MDFQEMFRALNIVAPECMGSKYGKENCDSDITLTPLCSRVLENNTRAVEFLITAGHDVNEKLEDGRTALFIAVELGSTSMVALLIHHGANVNETDNMKMTPLHVACFYRYKTIVELLLNKKANIHAVSMIAGTPILSATSIWPRPKIVADPCEVVSLLIKHGANVNDKLESDNGLSSLLFALQENNPRLVDLLVTARADVNISFNLNGFRIPAIFIAIRKDLLQIVKSFLKHKKLDLTMTGPRGNTALHEACGIGNLEMVELLLERNINLNAQNVDLHTPLHAALAAENFHVAHYLLQRDNIEVDHTNKFQDLPLHLAIRISARLRTETQLEIKEKVIKTIIDKTKNINAEGQSSLTPLYQAVLIKDLTIIQYLAENGANVNLTEQEKAMNAINRNAHGPNANILYSVLQNTCQQKNNMKIVSVLLSNGAKVNEGADQHRPLRLAIQTGDLETVKELQNHGAEIDKECINKNQSIAQTCSSERELAQRKRINDLLRLNMKLLKNVRSNNYQEVKENIEAGACVNVSHARWGSPLIYASYKGYSDIVHLLLTNGANVNSKSATGFTSLHMASKFHTNSRIVQDLLLHGAYYNLKDEKYGRTPVQYTKPENQSETHSLLTFIDSCFENARLGNASILNFIENIKENPSFSPSLEVMKNAKNDAGQTLVCLARAKHCDFLEKLEKAFQEI